MPSGCILAHYGMWASMGREGIYGSRKGIGAMGWAARRDAEPAAVSGGALADANERVAIIEHDGGAPRPWRGSIRPGRPPTCHRCGGFGSSTIAASSSTADGPIAPRRWAGDRSICSAATASGPLPAMTMPACFGSCTAAAFLPSRQTARELKPRPEA
jgi:hypothetical protein